MIIRKTVVIVVLTAFVAGCSQSGDSPAQNAREIETNTVSAPLASTPSEWPSGSLEGNMDMPERQEAEGKSVTVSSPYETAPGLTSEVVVMINDAVQSCGDVLGPRCSGAVWDICDAVQAYWSINEPEEEQEWIDWTDEQKIIFEVMRIVCSANDLVHISELDSILSSKYRDEYFSLGHFSSFRDLLYNVESINFTISETNRDQSAEAFRLPEGTVSVLMPLIEKINYYFESETSRIDVTSDVDARRILSLYNAESESFLCGNLALDFFENVIDIENNAEECIENICSSSPKTTICYPSDRIYYSNEFGKLFPFMTNLERAVNTTILEVSTIAKVEIYWTMMPFICANNEIQNFSPGDKCRQLAALICTELANYSYNYVGSTHLSRIKNASCALGRHYDAWPRILARKACFESITELRMSSTDIFEADNYCTLERQECENNSSAYYDNTGRDSYEEGQCEILSEYYNLEILWKQLPSVCADETSNAFSFIESPCFSAIETLCYYEIGDEDLAISRIDRSLPAELYYKYVYEIRRAACHLNLPLLAYLATDNLSGVENLDSFVLLNSPVEIDILELISISSSSDPTKFDVYTTAALQSGIILNDSGTSTEPDIPNFSNSLQTLSNSSLTITNLDSITAGASICANADQMPITSNCSSALWSSCYDVRAEAGDRENPGSEVSSAIAYLCSAAYIAELAEISAAIFESFNEDYKNGRFNEFSEFIFEMITKKSDYFVVENNEIQVSSQLANNVPDDALPAMQSIGESLGKLSPSLLSAEEIVS